VGGLEAVDLGGIMQLDAEQLLKDSLPSMIEGFKAEIKASINWEVKNKTAELVSAHVQQWVKDNLVPEITAALVESKEGLVSLGVSLSPQIVEILTASLIASLKEKMEKSWERSKIFEAMFK
jgi:hypothetical protein